MNKTTPFPESAPDFSDPLGMLRACHQRLLDNCERLLKLADHLQSQGADSEALQAAAAIYRYFTTSARHHHADEEQDLFPRLARESLKLADLVHRLILNVTLNYTEDNRSVIGGLKRVSRPGCRIYCTKDSVPKVIDGLGLVVVSTSRGVMTGRACEEQGAGGEVLCSVW